ncbi:Xaa-Pro aminopeptidase [Hydrocarboniphaga sp.]|uniref:Xaa-Pro aminopeptidase n=1 Tax=Hydrocarboniphaga sp. TaxID=2033016 RepID=UPI003D130D81
MTLSTQQAREHARRRKELMRRIGVDAVAIIPASSEVVRARDTHFRFRQNSDFQYLSGFPEPDAIAVLAPGRKDGEFVLFTRPRDKDSEIWHGRRAGPEGAIADYGADQAFNIGELETQLPKLLAGREAVHYSLGEFTELDAKITGIVRYLREVSRRGAAAPTCFVALDVTLHEMRLFKSKAEIALMKKAAEVSARAHVRAMQMARPGRFEWQVMAEIQSEFERENMQPGYGSIVGGGDNACILHYTENNMALRDGDLLLIDAGGEYQGYTADITRTFPINGKFSAAQKAVYEIVLEANKVAIKTLKAGASVGKPHEVATRVLTEGMVDIGLLKGKVDDLIAQEKHRQFYMHGTGHWLGMDVHDVGRYKLAGKYRKFEPGMIMTVEPGLYIAPGTPNVDEKFWGIGIRIEDDVLVTDAAPEVLTGGVPKGVREIEALIAAA